MEALTKDAFEAVVVVMQSGLLLISIVLIWSLSGRADPLDRWEHRGSWPIAGGIDDILFADGTFIAVGEEGTIVTSTNGREWRAEDSGTDTLLHGVCRGN